jgi:hypothetical protein
MKKTKLIRFAESLIFLPIMTFMTSGGLPTSGVLTPGIVPQVVVLAQANQNQTPAVDPTLKLEADAIDSYFADHDMPLIGTGMEMATVADNNDIDWRLLPAIAVRESTGGKNACDKVENNPFGWNSCKTGFDSIDEAIETVAMNIGGNNPNTAKHYDSKDIVKILRSYNPPYVAPRYAEQVMAIMKAIGPAEDVTTTPDSTT